jgi:hypothetical protein
MAIEDGILSTIGKTPLVVLNKLFQAAAPVFYAKLEMLNPGGALASGALVRCTTCPMVSTWQIFLNLMSYGRLQFL